MAIRVRLGDTADVDAALSVYERSNLARRQGVWPNRATRVADVRGILSESVTWFLLAEDGPSVVGMAAAQPLRGDDATGGPTVPGGLFVNLIFVLPERWGEGIGGAILDAVLAEAQLRHCSQARLWTHEDNVRSHRLYRSRGFLPTGRIVDDEGEWTRQV